MKYLGSVQQVKNLLGNLRIFPFTISQFSRTILTLCQITFYMVVGVFSPPVWTYLFSFLIQEVKQGSRAGQKRFDFPFQNVATAPPDSWTFSSQWFVQKNFILPEENLGDVALVFRGKSSSVHLPLFCLTGAYNIDEF